MAKTLYTHWAYFPDEDSALRCVKNLQGFTTRVTKSVEGADWLLRACHELDGDRLTEQRDAVASTVTRHGGTYDGGEYASLGGNSQA